LEAASSSASSAPSSRKPVYSKYPKKQCNPNIVHHLFIENAQMKIVSMLLVDLNRPMRRGLKEHEVKRRFMTTGNEMK